MFTATSHPYCVPFDGSFRLADAPNSPPEEADSKKENKKQLEKLVEQLREQQERLYASDTWSVLLVFQAMDAAGKDSTIRAVLSGINPAGFQVYAFKQPSAEELDHDFLWRTSQRLPERGRIGVFNRSYYEEVLVVRVHPAYLENQRLPHTPDLDDLWQKRFESIRTHEQHLAESGTMVLKFFLNVSKEEQKDRFLARIDEPEKNWKFAPSDVAERQHWEAYMQAYNDVLRETSRPWAPWYCIPADSKAYMRRVVAEIILANMESLNLQYPVVGEDVRARLEEMRQQLDSE